MTEIEEIEARLGAALRRIEAGLADPGPEPDADLQARLAETEERAAAAEARADALEEGLDAERGAAAQLAERMRQGKRRHDLQVRRMQVESEEMAIRLEEAEAALARQRRANDRLRETSQALREAAEGGEAPPIDEALKAELDGLRAAREADREEIDAILLDLAPLLEREEEA